MQAAVDPSNYNTIQEPEEVHHRHTNTSVLMSKTDTKQPIQLEATPNPEPAKTETDTKTIIAPQNNIHDILDQQLK